MASVYITMTYEQHRSLFHFTYYYYYYYGAVTNSLLSFVFLLSKTAHLLPTVLLPYLTVLLRTTTAAS